MLSELRYTIRALRATPGFTAVALIVLTLGIGATTAIFSVVDAIVLKGLPFPESGRLVAVDETNPTGKGLPGGYVAAANFMDWRAQQKVFEDMAAYQNKGGFVVRDSGEPESLTALMVSASLFRLLRVPPRVGHAFTSESEVAGRDRVAVISDGLWKRRFGADPLIVGKTMNVETGVWEIAGVMPEGFTFPVGALTQTDLYVPYVPSPDDWPRGDGSSRSFNAQVFARLKPGISIEQARAQMEQVTGALKQRYPKWFADRWVGVTPLRDAIVGKARGWMLLLFGAVGCVLLIACVNVANLLLARATAKARDVSVRAALGATRWQLARGLLLESLVLSCAGTILGVIVAIWGVSVLRASLPPALPRLSEVAVNFRVLGAAAAAAMVTGLAFGVLPAWQFSRPNLAGALREGGRSGNAGVARQRARSLLLVAEVALAVVLLVGAGLFVSSFARLVRVDIGMNTSNVLTLSVSPKINFSKETVDADMARAAQTLLQVFDRVKQVGGIEVAAFTSGSVPLSTGWSRTTVKLPGGEEFGDDDDAADVKGITKDYFRAIGVPVLAGRAYEDADSDNPGGVVIINDVAAKRYFNGRNPIGQQLGVNGTRTVVGVVKAARIGGPEAKMRPEVYQPFNRKRAFGGTLVLRTSRDPASVVPDVRAAIRAVMPDLVIPEALTFDVLYANLINQRKFNMLVLAGFGVLALVIAGAGIYGVMAFIVEQRTQEIGVRMALGAQPGRMLRMVLTSAGTLMGIGLAIGLGAGWMLSRFVGVFLFQVEPHDPIVFVAAGAALLLAGFIAAFVPARRAAHVNPLVALRS